MAKQSTRAGDIEQRTLPDAATLRTDQRERRERIIAAAAKLMVSVDYDKIQVKDVADEAGVALGTLYRYFNSKDHLFACALVAWSAGFGARIDRASKAPAVDRVKAVYRRAARAFEREPRVYGAMIQLQSSSDEFASSTYRTFTGGQTEAFGSALSPIPSPRRDDVVAVMSAVLAANLLSWQLGNQQVSDVYVAIDRAANLIFSGPPAG